MVTLYICSTSACSIIGDLGQLSIHSLMPGHNNYKRITEDYMTYIKQCPYCTRFFNDEATLNGHIGIFHPIPSSQEKMGEPNKMPPEEGKRDAVRPRHDLIPLEFLDELASIFEEGQRPRPGMPEGYGDSWKSGGVGFLRDCLNHVSNHLHKYMNGDRTENHLSKVAWGALVVRYFDIKDKDK